MNCQMCNGSKNVMSTVDPGFMDCCPECCPEAFLKQATTRVVLGVEVDVPPHPSVAPTVDQCRRRLEAAR